MHTSEDDMGKRIPASFVLGDQLLQVSEIIDRWYEGGAPGRPEIAYFKVNTHGKRQFIIRYAKAFDAWAASELR